MQLHYKMNTVFDYIRDLRAELCNLMTSFIDFVAFKDLITS